MPPGPDWISSRATSGPWATCLTPLIYTFRSMVRWDISILHTIQCQPCSYLYRHIINTINKRNIGARLHVQHVQGMVSRRELNILLLLYFIYLLFTIYFYYFIVQAVQINMCLLALSFCVGVLQQQARHLRHSDVTHVMCLLSPGVFPAT